MAEFIFFPKILPKIDKRPWIIDGDIIVKRHLRAAKGSLVNSSHLPLFSRTDIIVIY